MTILWTHLPFLGFKADSHIGTSVSGFPLLSPGHGGFYLCPALNLAIIPSCFHLVEDTKAWWPSLDTLNAVGRREKCKSHSWTIFAGTPWSPWLTCASTYVCVCAYIGHPCSASPDGELAFPAWCHRGQLGNLSRAQGLHFNLNADLHNSSGIKPHCHNICPCIYLPLSAVGRCGVLGDCWPQIHLCFVVQCFFGAEKVTWPNVQESVGRAGASGREKAECGVKRRGLAEAEILSLVSQGKDCYEIVICVWIPFFHPQIPAARR